MQNNKLTSFSPFNFNIIGIIALIILIIILFTSCSNKHIPGTCNKQFNKRKYTGIFKSKKDGILQDPRMTSYGIRIHKERKALKSGP